MLVSILVFCDVEGLSRILGTVLVLVLALYRYRYTQTMRPGPKLTFRGLVQGLARFILYGLGLARHE